MDRKLSATRNVSYYACMTSSALQHKSLNSVGTVTIQIKILGIKDPQVARLKYLFPCHLYFSIPAREIG